MSGPKPRRRWGPADWKRLPDWAVDLERQRCIDSRRVTRATHESRLDLWWMKPPWNEM